MRGFVELSDDEDPNEGETTPGSSGGENKGENESEPDGSRRLVPNPQGMPPPRDPPTRGPGPDHLALNGCPNLETVPAERNTQSQPRPHF